MQVLFQQADVDAPNILYQCEHRLHRLSTETLRGIACQLLSNLGVDGTTMPFHNNIDRQHKRAWRLLTPEVVRRRDQAIIR